MTERLTAYANGTNTLAMIDGLRALGCRLEAAPAIALRFT
jgi:hypothetical protein